MSAALTVRTGALRPYRAIFGARFRMLLQYRVAAIAGVFTQLVFGLVLIMVYDAFYRSSVASARPMEFGQLTTYVWLGQALLATLPMYTDREFRDLVRSGGVVYELCRPIDLYGAWYARAVALRTAPAALRVAPMVVVAGFGLPLVGLAEWRLAAPASPAAAVGFAAALAGALALSGAISTLINISVLRTLGNDGITMLAGTVAGLGAGALIPLPLLPAWTQPVLAWSPFAGLFDLPFRLYSGHIDAGSAWLVLARQLGWTVVLVAFGRWLLARSLRRLVAQGG